MNWVDALVELLRKNLPSIVITLICGFLFFLLSTFTYRKYTKSVQYERRKKAIEILIDIVENLLVIKKDITLEKFFRIVHALERENEIELAPFISLRSILEDVELRIEKSRHLDPKQKENYVKRIEKVISVTEEQKKIIEVPESIGGIESIEEILRQLRERQNSFEVRFVKWKDLSTVMIIMITILGLLIAILNMIEPSIP